MKKLIFSSLIFALSLPFATGCSTDTHYDSVSTTLSIDIPEMPYDGSPVTIRQRFQFDRDLQSLQSMSLVEAWLSNPETQGEHYSLDTVKSISISIVSSNEEPSVFWMLIPSTQLHGDDALFSDFNVGDLVKYTDKYQQLELEIEVSLEPYYAMKYWREECDMAKNCTIKLPLSMQFKMED